MTPKDKHKIPDENLLTILWVINWIIFLSLLIFFLILTVKGIYYLITSVL